MPTPEDIAKAVVNYPIPNLNDTAPNSTTTLAKSVADQEVTQDRYQKATSARLADIEKTMGDMLLQLNAIQAAVTGGK